MGYRETWREKPGQVSMKENVCNQTDGTAMDSQSLSRKEPGNRKYGARYQMRTRRQGCGEGRRAVILVLPSQPLAGAPFTVPVS